jgi:hypothetical protein
MSAALSTGLTLAAAARLVAEALGAGAAAAAEVAASVYSLCINKSGKKS